MHPITRPLGLSLAALTAGLIVTGCSSTATPADNTLTPIPSTSTSASANPAVNASEWKLNTTIGELGFAMDPKAPKTVGAMSALAAKGYFDGTKCHRLTTEGIFVLQCGDPTGTGTGGPGYTMEDENLPTGAAVYPAGTVAMANAGPNTNGSQFFIVYDDSPLPPNYSVWAKVTSGLDKVKKVAANGTVDGTPDGAPKTPVTINTITVK